MLQNRITWNYCHLWLITIMIFAWMGMYGQKSNEPKLEISEVSELPNILNESSGMLLLENGNLLSHNDSGGKSELIEFCSGSKEVVRQIEIIGARNHDWEELAADSAYIYIGDFGNNGGTRKNLVIYRISKNEFYAKDEVQAELIRFNYPKQKRFRYRNFHNYDCEAMIVHEGVIYLFSKNRGDFQCDMYTIPAQPGSYAARKMAKFETDGLITAADINDSEDLVALLGYTSLGGNKLKPFVYLIHDFDGFDLKSGKTVRYGLDLVKQTEAICFIDSTSVYFSEEEENRNKGFLYSIDLQKLISR